VVANALEERRQKYLWNWHGSQAVLIHQMGSGAIGACIESNIRPSMSSTFPILSRLQMLAVSVPDELRFLFHSPCARLFLLPSREKIFYCIMLPAIISHMNS
jgi:hypothetical protein